MCKKINAQEVQSIKRPPRQELDNNTRIQIHLATYYKQSLCMKTQKFTYQYHNICLYCYRSLDSDFANLHFLTVIHYICIYARPPIEHCEICDYELTKFKKANRCRRCVYQYRNFISRQTYSELVDFYNSPVSLAIAYRKLDYKVPSMRD
jgi:hypothetical protein